MSTYRVRNGGSPESSGETFDNLDDAIEAAWELAEDRVCDPRAELSLGFYDLRDRGGNMGVCPEGDDGGYWPIIEEDG